jgi:hypothetical protein
MDETLDQHYMELNLQREKSAHPTKLDVWNSIFKGYLTQCIL